MKVTVLGASRNTGKHFVEQALESGAEIQITILARAPEKLTFTEEQLARLTVVKGDATNKQDIATAIEGADIILSSLGGTIDLLGRTRDIGVEETGIVLALEAIKETRASSPPRLIMVSSTGAGTNSDVPLLLRPLYSTMLRVPHRHKAVAEAAIKESGVPYTLVRPAFMTNGGLTKAYRADLGLQGYTISRQDVAHFVLTQCVLEDKWHNASPCVAY
ncbi:hypothetical protein LPJ70_004682 [Coemansia sp. RSA 2708]|nr:hypothetical protein LPJ70_004682 [Coemansia sp. RSA 2708]KAJ2370247.1 hypothetical protein H4S01_000491 [Coemansia sp. RSA 2610]